MKRETEARSETKPLLQRLWFGYGRLPVSVKDAMCLTLIIATQVVSTVLWLHWDTRPMPAADPNVYLHTSLKAFDILRQGGSELLDKLVELNPVRPPLYAIISTPLYSFINVTQDVAVLTNLLFTGIAILATYGLGKGLFGRPAGLLAAFVLSMNPTLVNQSRVYWPHYATVGMVALCLYLLIRTLGFSHWRYSLLFGLSLGTALLIRPIHPALHLLGPALLVGLRAVRDSIRCVKARLKGDVMDDQAGRMHSLGRLLVNSTVAVFGLSIALVWYIPNFGSVFGAVVDKVVNPKNIDPFSLKSFVWYARVMPRTLSWFFVVLLTIGLVLALVRFRRQSGILLAGLAVSYAGLVLNRGKAMFYFSPLFPSIAILSVFWVFRIENARLRTGIAASIVFMAVLNCTLASWPILPSNVANQVVRCLGGAAERDPSSWHLDFRFEPRPPRHETWPIDEIVAKVHKPSADGRVRVLVVTQTFYFNIFQLRYSSSLYEEQHPEARQSGSVVFARPKAEAPDLYLDLLDSDYIVWEREQPTLFAATFARPAELLGRQAPSLAQRFAVIQQNVLPDGRTLHLSRRKQPPIADLPPAERSDLLEDAVQVDSWSPKSYLLLSQALLEQSDVRGAIATFDEALHVYEQAIQSVPSYGSQNDGSYANVWEDVGEGLYDIGQYERAIAAYEEALRLDPSSQWVQQRLLQLYSRVEVDIQHPLRQNLGGVLAFLGYNIEPRSVRAGGTLDVTLWWQGLAEMDRDYTVFIHVVGPDDRIWEQEDRLLGSGDYPTSTWEAGQMVRQQYDLELRPDAPAGEYAIKTGIYYWETGERLPVWDEHGSRAAEDAIVLDSVIVVE